VKKFGISSRLPKRFRFANQWSKRMTAKYEAAGRIGKVKDGGNLEILKT
jgi:hypothetical protein